MIDLSRAKDGYATYLPAVTRSYVEKVIAPLGRPVPVTATDLNFLDPATTLFYLPAVLYSAGQADLASRTPNAITERNRGAPGSFVLGDSGGYQIIEGKLTVNGRSGRQLGEAERGLILSWLEEHGDWAMTLDVPTAALAKPGSGYTGFTETIHDTVFHLLHFAKHRRGRTKFLNCLHGRNIAWCDLFYNAVRDFGFEGWAFGSGYNDSWRLVVDRLLKLRDEGELKRTERLHFLGQGSLEDAVVLTALQRALHAAGFPHIRVTFDTSSPFRAAGRGEVYTGYQVAQEGFRIGQAKAPDGAAYVGSRTPFPWRSPVGDRITLGDLCARRPRPAPGWSGGEARRETTWDTTSYLLLMNHNLYVQVDAVIAANRVFALEPNEARAFVPPNLLLLRAAIEEAFKREDWAGFLRKESDRFGEDIKKDVDHTLAAYDDFLPVYQRTGFGGAPADAEPCARADDRRPAPEATPDAGG